MGTSLFEHTAWRTGNLEVRLTTAIQGTMLGEVAGFLDPVSKRASYVFLVPAFHDGVRDVMRRGECHGKS